MTSTQRHVPVAILATLALVLVAGGVAWANLVDEDSGRSAASATEKQPATSAEKDLNQISQTRDPVAGTSFVSPLVEIYGDVYIGERSFVAGNTMLRASPGLALRIGNETNYQDNVLARALSEDSTIGDETSIAHHALIRDSVIGDFAFVGFHAQIINAVVSDGALVSAGAVVRDVELPEDALVMPGQVITKQRQADALPRVGEGEEEFKHEVLDVNAEFAESYIELYESGGHQSVIGVGPNPLTSFNPEAVQPQIGAGTEIGELARVVGDVRIGPGSEVSDRASIRADEGAPITIGSHANIEERVTFHALKGTEITVGDDLHAGDDVVIHGPLRVGDGLTVGDDSVVFRVLVGDDVTIGEDVIVQGPANEEDASEPTLEIPDGAVIEDGAVITDERSLRRAMR